MRIIAKVASVGLFVSACGGEVQDEQLTSTAVNPNRFSPEVVIAWNARMHEVAFADHGYGSVKGARGFGMMHVAMHDALNAIEDKYEQFAYDGRSSGANPIAAASQAAYDVAISLYPNFQAELQAEHDTWLNLVPAGSSKNDGIAVGSAAAAAIIAERQGDGYPDEAGNYVFEPAAPGVYQTYPPHNGFVVFEGVGHWRPFFGTSGQFRSGPPPALTSLSYAIGFNEVKSKGAQNSTTRTAQETYLARWWRDDPEKTVNRVGQVLAVERGLNLWQAARMFALVNMSMFDAYVDVFEAKYHHNYWRPYTAIRDAANDGNSLTSPDPSWVNLLGGAAPPHPSYPSAHSAICTGGLRSLARVFGNNTVFTMESGAALPGDPATRSFESFSDASVECSLSRMWLGFHFRFDSVAGRNMGTNLANFGADHYLRPE